MENSSEMDMSLSKEDAVDEDLYSRQLYVMGHEAQKRMAKSDVLIVGLDGLGVEVAKNVILAGVKSVTLHDDKLASYEDLSSQFYISEDDIGQSRARVSAPKLAELNPYVPVSVISGNIQLEKLGEYAVVVLIGTPIEEQLMISTYCHANGIAVVVSDVFGVFGNIFCDFGEGFVVSDSNGETAVSSMIASISGSAEGGGALVTTLEESPHGLETGDLVVLSRVQDIDGINDRQFEVTVKDRFSFEISLLDADCSIPVGAQNIKGGYVNQVKKPVVVNFDSMANTIDSPGFIASFITKMGDRTNALHVGFRALQEFRRSQGGNLPQSGNMDHAEELYRLAMAINEEIKLVEDLSEFRDMLLQLALCAKGNLSPMCALLGGIAAQEVIKACSGKFMPIMQWFYVDYAEALPDEPLSMLEVSPLACRYDGQIAVFGKEMQDKICKLNAFLVGAGAIGCEMLKNWAMMGVSCSVDGSGITHVTDMDSIERSNLSRQFLFRNSDINRPKSVTAAAAAKIMNPLLKAKVYESKVAPETENIFSDDFYESLDFVCAALDNVQARLYVDQRCMFYHLPMLESGTLGTKGSTQVVVPCMTENYGASRDPVDEKSIPMCTLKFYPNQIEHTLQWGRELFEEQYKQTPDDCNNYLSCSCAAEFQNSYLANQQNVKLETLKRMHSAMVENRPQSFDDCVAWARLQFEELFCNGIKQLLHTFPVDKLTASGVPFWSGSKKPPTPLQFNAGDPLHMQFIAASASMRSVMFGIEPDLREEVIMDSLDRVTVPVFNPSDGVAIPTSDEESKTAASSSSGGGYLDDIEAKCSAVLGQLPPTGGPTLQSITFDKDVDSHMLVVASMGNLRARNYGIPEVDLHAARGIAGKIIPAIATTTAMVTGLICMELYKIMQNKPIEKLLNTSCNLAIPMFLCNEPEPPASRTTVINGKDLHWTPWDRVDIQDPDMTLKGLIDMMANEYGTTLTMLSSGVTMLYSEYSNKKKMQERMDMRLSDLVETVSKKQLNPGQKYMILEMINVDPETDEDVDLPYLRFRLAA